MYVLSIVEECLARRNGKQQVSVQYIIWMNLFFQKYVPGDKTAHSVTRETARMFLRVVDVRLGSEGQTV